MKIKQRFVAAIEQIVERIIKKIVHKYFILNTISEELNTIKKTLDYLVKQNYLKIDYKDIVSGKTYFVKEVGITDQCYCLCTIIILSEDRYKFLFHNGFFAICHPKHYLIRES